MAVKVVARPELTFWEKTYLPQILSGLKITFSHFFRNLFLHIAHLFGRLLHLPASATIQYPEELRPLMSRYRSRHRLTVREDNTPRCVGCMLCETVCPARCITIVPGEHPDPNVEKYPVRFDIEIDKCIFCGYCEEACPVDAIRLTTDVHLVDTTRDTMTYDKEFLLSWNPTKVEHDHIYPGDRPRND